MTIQQFSIEVPQESLRDLHARLADTRLLHAPDDAKWEHGTNPAYLAEIVAYWRDHFDWRIQERAMNTFHHFRTTIEDVGIHFIHERGKGPNPLPIILTHGFPDSFLRFTKVIPMLTDPASFGGNAEDAFDVVVPSLPGHGFSDKPNKPGVTFRIGDLWSRLMTKLGYARYAAHGGDWGSTITEHLARDHGKSLVGMHLTDVPFLHLFKRPRNLSVAEKAFLKKADKWQQKEGAYALTQSTRPASLAAGLMDSPSGLAAWILDKFYYWSDCDGNIEHCFSKDELLANITLYWVTETIYSSFQTYYDAANASTVTWMAELLKGWVGITDVPTGFASFPKDLIPPPRDWVERFYNLQRFTEMPRGGHFAALEQPELLVNDIREFFRPLRETTYTK